MAIDMNRFKTAMNQASPPAMGSLAQFPTIDMQQEKQPTADEIASKIAQITKSPAGTKDGKSGLELFDSMLKGGAKPDDVLSTLGNNIYQNTIGGTVDKIGGLFGSSAPAAGTAFTGAAPATTAANTAGFLGSAPAAGAPLASAMDTGAGGFGALTSGAAATPSLTASTMPALDSAGSAGAAGASGASGLTSMISSM